MKPIVALSSAPWLTGTLIALLGVLVARWLAPHFVDPARTALIGTGQIVGVAGLFVIALGVRRRLNRAVADSDSIS